MQTGEGKEEKEGKEKKGKSMEEEAMRMRRGGGVEMMCGSVELRLLGGDDGNIAMPTGRTH